MSESSLDDAVEYYDTSTFADASCRVLDELSQELKKSTDDDNFIKELEEFIAIMKHNEVDEEEFYCWALIWAKLLLRIHLFH